MDFKLIKYLHNQPKEFVYLYGIFLSFVMIFFMAMIKDYYVANFLDASIELVLFVLSFISLMYFHFYKNIQVGGILAIFITFISVLSPVYTNEFGHYTVVYAVIAPLGLFFLFKFRLALSITISFYLVVIALGIYGYYNFKNSYFLHDFDSIFNVIIITFIVLAFGLFYQLSHKKSYEALQKKSEHNRLLLQEVHHRVKNNLNVVGSILALQASREDGASKDALLNSKNRIEAISLTHEMIYKQDDLTNIYFYEYMTKLFHLISRTFTNTKNIKIEIENNNTTLSLEKMLKLALISNELLTNSFKHALFEDDGSIFISLKKENDSYIYIYQDNGVGLDDDFEINNLKSLGFKLIELSIKQLDSVYTIDSSDGFKLSLKF